ncbi:MAG: FG-GAP repeat domain-containing protein, partial [Candidatus Zixiibacteriota bacterium]
MTKKSFCFILLFIVFLPLSISFCQPQFDTWTTYWTGRQTSSVFVEDFNDDGHLDLAVSNFEDSNVTVLINNGNGTFAQRQNHTVAHFPASVFAYDLDGDTDFDLVTACSNNYDSAVSVLKNNGDGTFSPRADYPVGCDPVTAWVADLDGDGDGDIVTGSSGRFSNPSKTVSVLKNNGDGTFVAPVKYTAGNNSMRIIVSDIDGDGDQDILTANEAAWTDSSEIVSVLKNNGDGTFADGIGYGAVDSFQEPLSLCASDFDGDGDQDLAVAVGRYPDSSVVSILTNEGGGNFDSRTNYIVENYPHYIYAADLDNDGDDDLAIGVSYSRGIFGNIFVFKNNGDGTFAPRMDYPTGAFPVSLMAKDID